VREKKCTGCLSATWPWVRGLLRRLASRFPVGFVAGMTCSCMVRCRREDCRRDRNVERKEGLFGLSKFRPLLSYDTYVAGFS
jgi:hypothetical protein